MSNLMLAIATGVSTLKERDALFQQRLAVAQSENETDLIQAVSVFGLDGCAVIFSTVCNNPATTLKVAEAALQELGRYLGAGWDACALEARSEWRRKYVELVVAKLDATAAQVEKAYELFSCLSLDWADYVRLRDALAEKIPAQHRFYN